MPTATKTWHFSGSVESWVNSNGTRTTSQYQSGDTSSVGGTDAGGCLEVRTTGTAGAATSVNNRWEVVDTWENIFGIPANSNVQDITLDYDWKCSEAVGLNSPDTGPATLRTSDGSTGLATLSTALVYSGTTSWATRSGGAAKAVPAAQQPSNTSIMLRIAGTMALLAGASNAVTIRKDRIVATITYQPKLEATVAAATSASAALTTQIRLGASGSAATSSAAALLTAIALAASNSALASGNASLATQINLAASSAIQAIAAGNLASAIRLLSSAVSATSSSANLATSIALAASGQVSSSAVADIATQITLAATSAASTSGAAALATQILLSAAGIIDAVATADLTDAPNPFLFASGQINTASSAALATEIALAALAQTNASSAADLATLIRFAAHGLIDTSADAELSTSIALATDSEAVTNAAADLATSIALYAIGIANTSSAAFLRNFILISHRRFSESAQGLVSKISGRALLSHSARDIWHDESVPGTFNDTIHKPETDFEE